MNSYCQLMIKHKTKLDGLVEGIDGTLCNSLNILHF